MNIVHNPDGTPVLQLDAEEMLTTHQMMEYGIDCKQAGGWVPEYKNKMRRTQALIRYAWQMVLDQPTNSLEVMNANLRGYERQLLREFP